jgi:hypothetical protein
MPSVPHIIIHALWGAVNTTFGMFGLRPVYALYVIIGLFSVGLIMPVRGNFEHFLRYGFPRYGEVHVWRSLYW